MSARRLILTVMLVFLPAGCAGTDRRGDSPPETSAIPTGTVELSSQSAADGPVENNPEPLSTQTTGERPASINGGDEDRSPAGGVQASLNTEATPAGSGQGSIANTNQTQAGAKAGSAAAADRDSRNNGNNGQTQLAVTASKPDDQPRAVDALAGIIGSTKSRSTAPAPAISGMATADNKAAGLQTVAPRTPGKAGEAPKPAPGNLDQPVAAGGAAEDPGPVGSLQTATNTVQPLPGGSAGAAVGADSNSQSGAYSGHTPPAVTTNSADEPPRADDAPARIIDSAEPRSTASAPAVSSMGTVDNEADGAQTVAPRTPGTAGEAPMPAPGNRDEPEDAGGEAEGPNPVGSLPTATNTETATPAGQAQETAANIGQTQPVESAGAAAKADNDSQSGAYSGPMPQAVTNSPADEPPRVAVLRPDGQGGQPGAPADDAPAAVIDPDKPPEPPKPQSSEDKSLDCDVIELMGKAIGRWRRQGEDRKPATDKAIEEVLQETGSVRDRRFVFGGRVYGMLIYRLKQDHTVEGFGAYAHSACLVLRGGMGIVPADKTSESRLDQALTVCESSSRAPGELNACISERMEEIVRQRGAWNG